jgi:hypothetical protein
MINTDLELNFDETHCPDDGNREARCSQCGRIVDSNPSLPFFEDTSEGSEAATLHCKCGYYESAHSAEMLKARNIQNSTVIERGLCKGFESHGAYEYDRYYCGCRGWD